MSSQTRTQKSREKPLPNKKSKSYYEQYLTESQLSHGLKKSELIQGVLRINSRNYEEAYISDPDGGTDIIIVGLQDRNRALHGDAVVVALKAKSKLKLPERNSGNENCADNSLPSFQHLKKDSGENVSFENSLGQCLENFESISSHESDGESSQKIAKVVAVIQQKHSRCAAGHMKPIGDKNSTFALFSPIDSRVPRILIPLSECPANFSTRPTDYANTLFIARITSWPETSKMAKGKLHRSLGEAGEIEPETEGFLTEYGLNYEEFGSSVLDCLPHVSIENTWKIPQAEYDLRKDLRYSCIFTIDPSTARDLDDALSCVYLEDDIFEVGVHIADVSYFVRENTPLDDSALERATSVYLVQKVIPMLPRLLCEQLCSLNPGEDRLAFSVIWHINSKGQIISEWFGRTIIRSCIKMAYDHAQQMIENPETDLNYEQFPKMFGAHDLATVKDSVLTLNKIAVNLRKRRFDEGALRLDQVKLQFSLDDDSGLPNGYCVYKQKDSHRLVEEFMLLANMAVAHKIYEHYPDKALLRRHPPPKGRLLDVVIEMCASHGIEMDASSSATLQNSLAQHLSSSSDSEALFLVLTSLLAKPMELARYFCAGVIQDEDAYHHYALNVPLYTHFTSPIRRYPDIIVHRLLAAAIECESVTSRNSYELQTFAEHCNDKKNNAKQVSELSSQLFFATFVRTCGPLEEKGMVMGVLDHSFDVLVIKVGVVKRVYCEHLPLKNMTFKKQKGQPELILVWDKVGKSENCFTQVIRIFSFVAVKLMANEYPTKFSAVLVHPELAL